MKYIDQSAKSLRLSIMEKEYNPKNLTILTTKNEKIRNTNITYGILGESHYLKIFNKNFFFSEILACIEMESEGISLDTNKKEIKTEFYTYTFEKETVEWNYKAKEKYIRFETYFTDKIEFPSKEKQKFKPITALILTKTSYSKEIIFESMHAYPNENKLVFSKSIIVLNKD